MGKKAARKQQNRNRQLAESQKAKNNNKNYKKDESLTAQFSSLSLNGVATLSIRPAGLPNLGNTCYFNSVLQVLGQTYILHETLTERCRPDFGWNAKTFYIKEKCGKSYFASENLQVKLAPPTTLINSFLQVQRDIFQQKSPNPRALLGEIRKERHQFQGYNEQDSQELFISLIDCLKKAEKCRQMKALLQGLNIDDPKNASTEDRNKANRYGITARHTVLDAIFGGQLLSIIHCTVCNYRSFTFEPFIDLSLPLDRHTSFKMPTTLSSSQKTSNNNNKNQKNNNKKNKQANKTNSDSEPELEEPANLKEESEEENSSSVLTPQQRKKKRQQKKLARREAKKQLRNQAQKDQEEEEVEEEKEKEKEDQDIKDSNGNLNNQDEIDSKVEDDVKPDLLPKKNELDTDKGSEDSGIVIVCNDDQLKKLDDEDSEKKNQNDIESELLPRNESKIDKSSDAVIVCNEDQKKNFDEEDSEKKNQNNIESKLLPNKTELDTDKGIEDSGIVVVCQEDQMKNLGEEDSEKNQNMELNSDNKISDENKDVGSTGIVENLVSGDCNNEIVSINGEEEEEVSDQNENSSNNDADDEDDDEEEDEEITSGTLAHIDQEFRSKFYDYVHQKISYRDTDYDNKDLGTLFKNFIKEETLDGANKYLCENCIKLNGNKKTYSKAIRSQVIALPPPVLVLHLKRFESSGGFGGNRRLASMQKLNTQISYPEKLNLSSYTSRIYEYFSRFYEPDCDPALISEQNESRLEYTLYGVVIHSGGLRSGHYMAYVCVRPDSFTNTAESLGRFLHLKPFVANIEHILSVHHEQQQQQQSTTLNGVDPGNKDPEEAVEEEEEDKPEVIGSKTNTRKWYHVSDSSVSPTTIEAVLNDTTRPYLLFYERTN